MGVGHNAILPARDSRCQGRLMGQIGQHPCGSPWRWAGGEERVVNILHFLFIPVTYFFSWSRGTSRVLLGQSNWVTLDTPREGL